MHIAIQEQRVEEAADADQNSSYEAEPAIAPREQRGHKGEALITAYRSFSQLTFFRGIAHFSFQFVKTIFQAICWLVYSTIRYLRYHPTHALFTGLLFGVIFLLLVTGSRIHDRLILSEISDETLNAIIDASRWGRNFENEEARQFTNVGAPRWAQREAIRAVLFHARKARLPLSDQAVLLATVEIESGFNPMARATATSACGLFQFVRETGKSFGLEQADCMDPWRNAEAGILHYQSIQDRVRKGVDHLQGSEQLFKTFELSYYLHHDGLYSSNPSEDLKATVLGGVQFLFHVHSQLEREAASKNGAPTFTQAFAEDVWETLSPLVASLADAVGVDTAVAAEHVSK